MDYSDALLNRTHPVNSLRDNHAPCVAQTLGG